MRFEIAGFGQPCGKTHQHQSLSHTSVHFQLKRDSPERMASFDVRCWAPKGQLLKEADLLDRQHLARCRISHWSERSRGSICVSEKFGIELWSLLLVFLNANYM